MLSRTDLTHLYSSGRLARRPPPIAEPCPRGEGKIMSFNRTFFALVFALAVFIFTAKGQAQGLTIDPDGAHAASTATTAVAHATPFDQGLTIDPDGRQ